MNIFPIHATDFYKTGHIKQYPKGTEYVYSNFTCRSAKHFKALSGFDDKVVFFGLQGVIQWLLVDLWDQNFFRLPLTSVLQKYKQRMDTSLGEGVVSTDHIAALHALGYLPLRIKALPEGSRVNIRVPLFTIINTRPEFYWLTNYVETQLSAELWKPITSATIAYEYRRLLLKYAEETGVDKAFVDYQGHDFSMRGMSGIHDATQSGAAHLLSFKGTDTITALDYIDDYYYDVHAAYPAQYQSSGGSVPATEHSVMCMGGSVDEFETFKRLITETYPAGIVSIVSDTWDFWQVITDYTQRLRDVILLRNGKVVLRPDSGDPVKILTGSIDIHDLSEATSLDAAKDWAEDWLRDIVHDDTPHGEFGDTTVEGYFRYDGAVYKAVIHVEWDRHDKQFYYIDGTRLTSFEQVTLTPEQKGAVECLWEVFGGKVNDKGFKELHPNIGLIYGDSITLEIAKEILRRLKDKGFASNSAVLGIGSYTYQYVTRDTFGSAVKATWGVVNGEARELFKDPKTDTGLKKSARGLLRVEKEGDNFVLYDQQTPSQEARGELRVVYDDGEFMNMESFRAIRERLHESEVKEEVGAI